MRCLGIALLLVCAANPQAGAQPPAAKSPAESLQVHQGAAWLQGRADGRRAARQDPIAFAWGPDGKFWVVEMGDYPLGVGRQGQARRPHQVPRKDQGRRRALRQDDRLPRRPRLPDRRDALRQGRARHLRPGHLLRRGHRRRRQGGQEGRPLHRLPRRQSAAPRQRPGLGHRQLDLRRQRRLAAARSSRSRPARSSTSAAAISASSPTPASSRRSPARRSSAAAATTGATGSATTTRNPMYHFRPRRSLPRRNPHLSPPDPRVPVSVTPGAAESSRSRSRCRASTTRSRSIISRRRAAPSSTATSCSARTSIGNSFVSEPVHNLVHREIVKPKGVTFTSQRAADEQKSEFLASSDNWFRPTMIADRPRRRPVGRRHVPLRDRASGVDSEGLAEEARSAPGTTRGGFIACIRRTRSRARWCGWTRRVLCSCAVTCKAETVGRATQHSSCCYGSRTPMSALTPWSGW